MSSHRLSYTRKRRSVFEASDSDCEDDFTPVRKIRRHNGDTNLKQSITTKCRQLWHWISDLPIKGYFKETMFKRSVVYNQPVETIDLDEDEDDKEDITIVVDDDLEEEDEVAIIEEVKSHSAGRQHNSSPETFVSEQFGVPNPLMSSTPFYHDTITSYNRTVSSLPHKPVNGYHSDSWRSKDGQQNGKKNSYSHRVISPITNPGVDVEILLDSQRASKASNDLEIVSELSQIKKSAALPRRSLPVSFRLSRPSSSQGFSSDDSTPRENGSEQEKSMNNSFTAHEVVRLQEKEQYKLLLDKLVGGSIYHPISKKNSKSIECQVNLTEEEEPVMRNHFKKEVLQKPVAEFLEKYYKPCHLKSPTPQQERISQKKPSVEVDISDADDEVGVVASKLPQYKPRSKMKPDFFSPSWIAELKQVMHAETEKTLQIVTEQEEKIERYRKRRDAKIAENKLLLDQYKLSGAVLPESIEVDEYPALSPDVEAIIDSALEQGDPSQVICTLERLDITHADISTLNGLSWLNDQIINFYVQLIVERSKMDNYPSIYAFNSFFYLSVKSRGEGAVMRWTRRVDIFSYDIILVPLHLGLHWALAVVDNRSKKVKYYDSMSATEDMCLRILQNYLVVELKDKKKIAMDPQTYTTEIVKGIPQQMNGSDCGMFALKYAEYISRDADIKFTQDNMPYFRRKMIYEIMTKQLL